MDETEGFKIFELPKVSTSNVSTNTRVVHKIVGGIVE